MYCDYREECHINGLVRLAIFIMAIVSMAIGNNLKMLLGEKLEKLCCFTVNCGFYSKRIAISAQFFIIKLHLCELL